MTGTDAPNVVTQSTWRDSNALLKSINAKLAIIRPFQFSARLSEPAEPIRELYKDKVPFNWGPEHHTAFKQIKKEIVRAPMLAYYNPKRETTLQTDASIKGIGACLLQD